MKKLFSFFIFIVLMTSGFNVYANRETYVNRHHFQNGSYEIRDLEIKDESVWTKNRSPYVVEGNIIISPHGSLTIEEGVQVLFLNSDSSDLNFVVQGELIIDGTFGRQVVFTEYSVDNVWCGISFMDGSIGNINFAEFHFGGYNSPSVINIASSDIKITNTLFADTLSSAISIYGPVDPIIQSTGFDLGNKYAILQNDVNANPIYKDLFSHNNDANIKIVAGTSLDSPSLITRSVQWKDSSLPYVIDGWLHIGNNGKLDILSSTKVLFSGLSTSLKGNISVLEGGHLVANSVYFGSDEDWDYIYGESGSKIDLKYCNIYGGGYNDYGSLRIDTNNAYIHNTTVSNSKSHGIYFGKSHISPTLKDITLEKNQGYGIYLKENSKPSFSGVHYFDNGRNGIFVASKELNGSNNWNDDEGPYFLSGIYSVMEDSTLVISSGTTIYFDEYDNFNKSSIVVEYGGKLISKGSSFNPILFTSSSSSPKAGDWGSIVLREGSVGRFEYSIFEYGGANDFIVLDSNNSNYAVLYALDNNLVVNNSVFRDLNNHGIYIDDGVAPFSILGNKFHISPNLYGIYKWDNKTNIYAKYNWWDHWTGPYNLHSSPTGDGCMASDEINTTNFLTSIDDNQWNNISANKKLLGSSNSNKTWSIKFNGSLDPKYVNTSYINVISSSGEYMDIKVQLKSNDNKTITVAPLVPYEKGIYHLIIKEGMGTYGNNLLKKRIIANFSVN